MRERAPTRQQLGEETVSRSLTALALAGGVLGGVAVDLMMYVVRNPHSGVRAGLEVGTTAVVVISTTLLFRYALRRSVATPRRVRGRTLRTCALLGWLNCPLSFLILVVLSVIAGPRPHLGLLDLVMVPVALVLGGLLIGLLTGLPLGLLYGAGALFATERLARLRARPSHDSASRAAWAVGVTVLGAGLFATLMSLVAGRTSGAWIPLWVPATLAGLGGLLAIRGALFRRRIDRLVGALREGPVEGYARVPIEELGEAAGDLLPLTAAVTAPPCHVLMRILPPRGPGAYRESDVRLPWALVD